MPNRSSKKQPRDINQLAASIVGEATAEDEPVTDQPQDPPDPEPERPEKNPAAVELGRRGGLKGGKARAAKLTPEERSRIAREAAQKRWASRTED
jgi:hypothetical protein